MKLRRVIYLLAQGSIFALFATTSHAQSIPRFDVEAYCKEVSRVSGGSATIYNGCVTMEQDAYDALKTRWESIPEQTRAYCENVARVTGGSYNIFGGCVEIEVDASNSP